MTKVLTIEASGIAIATMLGYLYDVPVVFAKKGETANSTDDKYMSQAYSFTYKRMNNVFVSKPYLHATDRVLIVDDFLADGHAVHALIDLVHQAGAQVVGIGIAYTNSPTLKKGFSEFRTIIEKTIQVAIIPLLPLYIFGIFLGMTYTGEAYHIIIVFAKIICIIFALHIIILMYEFLIAGGLSRKNPLRLLVNMLPAYFTALGTSSSAATIPVTLRQTKKNDVSDEIANFCVPLCATIHLSGSMMKITCCALTVCLIGGLPHDLPLFLHFIMLLGVCMVAAPGVPGGAVMAALGPMAGVLGFTPDAQALIIALYIAMDSFGTACNVTGDGALAVIIDKLHKSDASLHPSASGLQKDA